MRWLWTFFGSVIAFLVCLTAMHIIFPLWVQAIIDGKLAAFREMTDLAKSLAALIGAITSVVLASIALVKTVSSFRKAITVRGPG